MATVTMDAMDPKSKGLAKLLKKNKVKMEILTMRGPSGWPEVKLTGKREDLETVLADREYGWNDPELAEYIEEGDEKAQEADLTDYIDISWHTLCEDYNLSSGDISPYQQSRVDNAVEEINKVLIEFVKQNSTR